MLSNDARKVLQFLRKNSDEMFTMYEIAEQLGMNNISPLIKNLCANGYIEHSIGARAYTSSTVGVYTISEKGNAALETRRETRHEIWFNRVLSISAMVISLLSLLIALYTYLYK